MYFATQSPNQEELHQKKLHEFKLESQGSKHV